MHVAVSSVNRLLDYSYKTEPDGYTTTDSVVRLNRLIDRNFR